MSGNATAFTRRESPEDLTAGQAAELLGVPPAALERWARHLAFPHDAGGGGSADAPRFRRSEIEALRDALVETHSVEGAVRAARDRSDA